MSKSDFLRFSERQKAAIVAKANSLTEGFKHVYRSFVMDGSIPAFPAGDRSPTSADIVAAMMTANTDSNTKRAPAQATSELRRIVTCVDEISSLEFLRTTMGGVVTGLATLSTDEVLEGLSEGEICYELSLRLETLVSHVYSIPSVF